MTRFNYKARDASGVSRTGAVTADSPGQVAARLRGQNLFVVEITEAQSLPTGKPAKGFRKKVTRQELAMFCRQLAVMITAGVPLLSALKVLRAQAEKEKLRDALEGITAKLEGGNGFAQSLAEYPEIFPKMVVTMVEAAEAGGVLDNILERVASFLEWEHRIREKVKSSITYPVAVLIIAVLAVSFVITFVLPAFSGILSQMDVKLPLITKVILGMANGFRHYWYLILPLVIGPLLGIFYYVKTSPEGRRNFDSIIIRIPVIGGLLRKTIISRFCRTLAALLRVGVPVISALEVVEKTCGNMVVEESIARARAYIYEGEGMAEPLRESGIFPPLVIEMINVGEETGSLDSMLEKVGDFYDEEVENLANRLSTVIEPVLIVFVGGIVCLVLLSVFLPLFKVIGSVG